MLRNGQTGEVVMVRCGASSPRKCEPCSVTYRRRVRRVASHGILLPGRVYLLTLTAPGSDAHRLPSGELCACTPPGGVDLATWNGRSSARWNDFVTDMRRTLGIGLEYFRAVEVQRRGALHLHVLVRVVDGASRMRLGLLRSLAIHHGFGHSVDLQEVTDSGRAAGYCAKYVSKAAGDRGEVPYVHPTTGEVAEGRWRTWTASRGWGESMAGVRQSQAEWWRTGGPGGAPTEEAADRPPLDPNRLSYAEGSNAPPSERSSSLV